MVPRVISGRKVAACIDSTAEENSAGHDAFASMLASAVSGFVTGSKVSSAVTGSGRRAEHWGYTEK